jgi:hypothetical protein
MNNDIQHCDGKNCELKGKCFRYTDYKALMKSHDLIWMFMTPPNEFGSCKHFYENK